MTKAKITKKDGYRCAPQGAIIVVFECGEIVTGQVASWALADNAASALFDPRESTKVQPRLESKRKKGGK